jgi:hypothetical protein
VYYEIGASHSRQSFQINYFNPKWSQFGPGCRQGVFENQQQHETSNKKRKRKHHNEKTVFFFECAAISSKIGGLNGWPFTDVL